MRPTITLFEFWNPWRRLYSMRLGGRCEFGYRRFDFRLRCYWLMVVLQWNAIESIFNWKTRSGFGIYWNSRLRSIPEGEYIHEHRAEVFWPGERQEWEFGR